MHNNFGGINPFIPPWVRPWFLELICFGFLSFNNPQRLSERCFITVLLHYLLHYLLTYFTYLLTYLLTYLKRSVVFNVLQHQDSL